MNLIWLLIFLTGLLFIVYVMNDFDYIVPSFFMTGSFIVSALISLLAKNRWQYIRFNTTVVILAGLVAFAVGDLLVSKINIRIPSWHIKVSPSLFKKRKTDWLTASIDVPKYLVIVIACFMLFIDYYYFKYIYELSIAAGNPGGYSQMFEYARQAVINVSYDIPMQTWLEHGVIVVECIGYVFLFVFIHNIIISKKVDLFNLIPCGLYIVNLMLSTARIDVINFVCAIIIFYSVISLKKNKTNIRLKPKIVIYGILAIVIVLASFRLLGYLTGKSNTRELWRDLSTYGGSSIPALDKYINSPKRPNSFFGQESLNRLYAVLRALHLTDVKSYNTTLPFVHFPDGSATNIYTGLRRYIQDYGYLGMTVVLFAMGCFYSLINRIIKRSDKIGIGLIIYAYIFYPVVMTFVDERFLISFTSLSLPYHILYFMIIYRIIVGETKDHKLVSIKSVLERKK